MEFLIENSRIFGIIQGYKDIYSTPGLHVDIWIKLTYLQNGIYITILKIILKIIIEIIIMIIVISFAESIMEK